MESIRNNRGIFDSMRLGWTLAKLISFVEGEKYIYTMGRISVMRTSEENYENLDYEHNCIDILQSKMIATPDINSRNLNIWLGERNNPNDYRDLQNSGRILELNLVATSDLSDNELANYFRLPLIYAGEENKTSCNLPSDGKFFYVKEFIELLISRSKGVKKLSDYQLIEVIKEFVDSHEELIKAKRAAKVLELEEGFLDYTDALWREIDPTSRKRIWGDK